jgi:hypothetical protein
MANISAFAHIGFPGGNSPIGRMGPGMGQVGRSGKGRAGPREVPGTGGFG